MAGEAQVTVSEDVAKFSGQVHRSNHSTMFRHLRASTHPAADAVADVVVSEVKVDEYEELIEEEAELLLQWFRRLRCHIILCLFLMVSFASGVRKYLDCDVLVLHLHEADCIVRLLCLAAWYRI